VEQAPEDGTPGAEGIAAPGPVESATAGITEEGSEVIEVYPPARATAHCELSIHSIIIYSSSGVTIECRPVDIWGVS